MSLQLRVCIDVDDLDKGIAFYIIVLIFQRFAASDFSLAVGHVLFAAGDQIGRAFHGIGLVVRLFAFRHV